MVLNAEVLRASSVSLDLTFTGSLMRSEMVDLGGQPTINVNLADQQIREGYSIGGYWARPYTFSDANNDGIIAASEVSVGDTAEYVGPFLPTRTAGLTLNLGMFRNRLNFSSTFDYRGGHFLYNLQEDFRCRSSQNCRALYDIDAPLEDQARIVALRFQGALNTTRGFMEEADYMKWREASLIFTTPESWARAIRAERLTIGLTGRNLALFTGYSGPDPEVNGQGEGNFAQRDFLSLPSLRTISLRFNVTF
jgi:TonB-dependent starch-binding outer membrane protein SusC